MIKNICGILIGALAILQLIGCGYSCHDYYERYGEIRVNSMHIAYMDSIGEDSDHEVLFPDFYVAKNQTPEPLSFKLVTGTDFWVNVYGCRTHECPEATAIVVHNYDYSYERLILPPNFKISKFKGEISASDDDLIQYLFRLDIDTEDLSLSWDIEIGEKLGSECYSPYKPAW